MLSKVQGDRLDDQRGVLLKPTKLPEFLKSSSDTDEGSSPRQPRLNKGGARSTASNSQRYNLIVNLFTLLSIFLFSFRNRMISFSD